MLVGERMSHPVMSVAPDLPIMEALNMMKGKNIRRFPVVKDGRLVGIVAERDLLNASTAPTTTLSVWELNYQLSRIKVKDATSKKVITVQEDASIEAAARIMTDKKVGGLPVMRGDELSGIITETDLFEVLLVQLDGGQRAGRACHRLGAQCPRRVGEIDSGHLRGRRRLRLLRHLLRRNRQRPNDHLQGHRHGDGPG